MSRVGRLTLVKSVLEVIPVYWMSIAWIPKGVLENIGHICFSFLWQGKKEEVTRPWVKWERVATPKALEGWGLNIYIYKFLTALAAKCGWRLISTTNLWTKVVLQKYIAPNSLIDWIRHPQKSCKGGSIFWKSIIKSFHLVEEHLAWNVGDGNSVRIGLDPWLGNGLQHLLPQNIREHLAEQGILHLNQVTDPRGTTIWRQAWMSGHMLWFPKQDIPMWEEYIGALTLAHIHIQDRPNELLWVGDPSRIYTPKAGYVKLCTDLFDREEQWWWRKVWKLRFLAKARLLVWTNLENKMPTWDILQKRNHHGSGWCSMCKSDSESITHMFITCRFAKEI